MIQCKQRLKCHSIGKHFPIQRARLRYINAPNARSPHFCLLVYTVDIALHKTKPLAHTATVCIAGKLQTNTLTNQYSFCSSHRKRYQIVHLRFGYCADKTFDTNCELITETVFSSENQKKYSVSLKNLLSDRCANRNFKWIWSLRREFSHFYGFFFIPMTIITFATLTAEKFDCEIREKSAKTSVLMFFFEIASKEIISFHKISIKPEKSWKIVKILLVIPRVCRWFVS